MNKVIHLVCNPQWMVNELMMASDYEIIHHYGFDFPPMFHERDLWWAPQSYMAKLNHYLLSKNQPSVLLPGSGMREVIQSEKINGMLSRDVSLISAGEALIEPKEGWWKLLDHKDDKFMSRWRNSQKIVQDILDYGMEEDEELLFCSEELTIVKEFRVFFYNSEAKTASIYLDNSTGNAVDVYNGAEASQNELDRVLSYSQVFINNISSIMKSGVVDIAMVEGGSLCALEVNTPWSSGWYNCNISEVCETIRYSFDEMSIQHTFSSTLMSKFFN